MLRLVVIGGGQAGFSLASELRKISKKNSIKVICKEKYLPYQRPPLSKKFLLSKMPTERLFFRSQNYYTENDINLSLNLQATKINRKNRYVEVKDGRRFVYDKLFLATGSRANILPKSVCLPLESVYSLRTIDDVDSFRHEFIPGKKIVIVGGGYIGLELASVAAQLGLKVTIIEAQSRILSRTASELTANFFRKLHREHKVKILENKKVENFLDKEGIFIGVTLNNGSVIEGDFALVGIGATPNTDLADNCGLNVDDGILVNDMSQTSDPNIFAAGDCTSFVYRSKKTRLESVGNAIEQATVAANSAIGKVKKYKPVPWFWSDQYDFKLQIAGLNTLSSEVVIRKGKKGISFWYFQGEDLVATESINDAQSFMISKKLIETNARVNKSDVSNYKKNIKSLIK